MVVSYLDDDDDNDSSKSAQVTIWVSRKRLIPRIFSRFTPLNLLDVPPQILFIGIFPYYYQINWVEPPLNLVTADWHQFLGAFWQGWIYLLGFSCSHQQCFIPPYNFLNDETIWVYIVENDWFQENATTWECLSNHSSTTILLDDGMFPKERIDYEDIIEIMMLNHHYAHPMVTTHLVQSNIPDNSPLVTPFIHTMLVISSDGETLTIYTWWRRKQS